MEIPEYSKEVRKVKVTGEIGLGMSHLAKTFNRAFFNKFDLIFSGDKK